MATSCLPSGLLAPTTSARLIFAVAGRRITAAPRPARRTPRARAPRPGSPGGGRSTARASAARSRSASPAVLDRVRQGLAPVREPGLDHLLHVRVVRGELAAPERDERGVDVRGRTKDGAGDRMEAGALGGQLDEDGDGPVRLRPGAREEPVGDLALDHDRPELEARQPVEALDDQRRGDVVRKVRDELPRCRTQCREVGAHGIAEGELDVRPFAEAVGEVRLERTVELDRMHPGDPVGEIRGQDAEPGPDLEHDVLRVELREAPDDPEDVVVDQEVLPEVFVRESAASRQREARPRRWRRSARPARRGSRREPRPAPSTVWTTFAGSFGRPRRGCGARYGTVGLGQDALGRDARGRRSQGRRPSET